MEFLPVAAVARADRENLLDMVVLPKIPVLAAQAWRVRSPVYRKSTPVAEVAVVTGTKRRLARESLVAATVRQQVALRLRMAVMPKLILVLAAAAVRRVAAATVRTAS